MKRALAAAAAALLLLACNRGNDAALDARIRQLTEQRDKEAGIAEHLDDYQKLAAKVQDGLSRTGVWDPESDAKSILLAASGAAGRCASAGFRKDGDTPLVTLSGSGAPEEAVACLDRFASAQPAMVLRALTLGDREWTAQIGLRGGPPAAAPTADPTPAPAVYELPGTRAKREQIARLETQVAEYDRLIAGVKDFDRSTARLQVVLDLIVREPDRLHNARTFWNAGWAGVDAPLASGTLELGPDGKATLRGPLRKGVDAAALAEIASKRQLEIASLDGSGATLTGTFTTPSKGP